MRILKRKSYEPGYLFSEKNNEIRKNINFIEHLLVEMGFEKKRTKKKHAKFNNVLTKLLIVNPSFTLHPYKG